MTNAQIADALDLTEREVRAIRVELLDQTGMGDSIEFARQQNAGIRELFHP